MPRWGSLARSGLPVAVLVPRTTQLLEPSRSAPSPPSPPAREKGMVASAAAAPSAAFPMPERSSPGAGSSARCGSVGQSAVSRSRPRRVSSSARSISSSALPVIDRVHALARRMVGYEQAPELTQDVFVRAWQKLHTFRGEARFSTWLHRLAVNLILSKRAAFAIERNRFIGDDEVLERVESRPPGRDHHMDFEKAIAQLPNGARMIFVLHDVEGYRHEEIAGLLGVTTGTTKAQLHRARMLLRGHLGA